MSENRTNKLNTVHGFLNNRTKNLNWLIIKIWLAILDSLTLYTLNKLNKLDKLSVLMTTRKLKHDK
jgi:hypothetical protein